MSRRAITGEAAGDGVLTARALVSLGILVALQGDAAHARPLLERGLALFRETAHIREAPIALIGLGRCFVLLNDLRRAEAIFSEALGLARQHSSTGYVALILTDLSHLKLRRRDIPNAAALALQVLREARAIESRLRIKSVVMLGALVSGGRGDLDRAARLIAAVDAWRDWGVAVPPYHDVGALGELRSRARRQLGDAAYDAAVAEGRAMSVEGVADLAEACLEAATARGETRSAGSAAASSRPLLSERERAVLRLIGEGLSNKQIATALGIRERTAKWHVTSAMNKLGVDNRAHAAVAAIQRGLL
jgi:DNA-binding CsgD family transcriptional regulator